MDANQVLFAKYMIDKNYAAAERICRLSLQDKSSEAFGLIGLALLSLHIGRKNFEEIFLEKLAMPFGERYKLPLSRDAIAPRTEIGDGLPRYLVVTARGCGLWSDFASVVGAYMLAWLTGRILITSWRHESAYSEDYSHDAFIDFFKPLSNLRVEDLSADSLRFEPETWTAETLKGRLPPGIPENKIAQIIKSDADVVVCNYYVSPFLILDWILPYASPSSIEKELQLASIFERVARPSDSIKTEIDGFISDNFGEEPFIAVHLRGTDKFLESPETLLNNNLIINQALTSNCQKVFVMTDDTTWLENAKVAFGDKLVTRNSERTSGNAGLHYTTPPNMRKKLGIDIVIETFVAVEAKNFFGNGKSNVSATISLLRKARLYDTNLVGENNLLNDNDWGLIRW